MKIILFLAMAFTALSLTACLESGTTRVPSESPTPPGNDAPADEPETGLDFGQPAPAEPGETPVPIELPEEEFLGFIDFPWDGKHPDTDMWNEFTYDAIDSDGDALLTKTPSDIENFCTNYNNLNSEGQKMFWIALVSAMAKFESSYKPETKFTESFNDSSGRPVISRGLLQLSYESARGYRCPISSGEDLHDPQINLLCTIKILNRWVDRDGVITKKVSAGWRGGARYWSVLRKNSTLSQIKKMTQETEVCQ